MMLWDAKALVSDVFATSPYAKRQNVLSITSSFQQLEVGKQSGWEEKEEETEEEGREEEEGG